MHRVLLVLALWTPVCAPQAPAPGQPNFAFHSGFWLNLHQFLSQQAAAQAPEPADSPEWRAALEYYRRAILPQGQLDDQPAAVNNRLSAAGSSDELPAAGLDPELVSALVKAAPLYRRAWWPQHNQANLAWIDAVEPLLAKYGGAMRKEIAAAYEADWPAATIRVDVSAYAGPHGAYTTTRPSVHITISSTDPGYRAPAALEMLFHETSHALDDRIRDALQRELNARDRLFRRREFSHAILFYTAGEIAQRHLPGYETYAVRNGIWDQGWPGGLAVLVKDWKPYLDGRSDLAAAVRAIVNDYGVPKPAQ